MAVLIELGPVAQSGRAPLLQSGGPGFKSRRVHWVQLRILDSVAKNGENHLWFLYEVKYECLYIPLEVYSYIH